MDEDLEEFENDITMILEKEEDESYEVEQWHGREQDPVFGKPLDVNHGGEIQGLFEFDLLTGHQCALQSQKILLLCRERLLQENLRLLHRLE